jgi:DNA modification methylase
MALALDAVHAALQTLLEQSRKGARGNGHPTVKPTNLMRYLCRLVTPAGGTVLEGCNFIGIELEAEYVSIARARIAFTERRGHQPGLALEAA